jgi:hypothetical protein
MKSQKLEKEKIKSSCSQLEGKLSCKSRENKMAERFGITVYLKKSRANKMNNYCKNVWYYEAILKDEKLRTIIQMKWSESLVRQTDPIHSFIDTNCA